MLMRQVVIAVTKRTSLLGALTSIRHAHLSGMHVAQACTPIRHAFLHSSMGVTHVPTWKNRPKILPPLTIS